MIFDVWAPIITKPLVTLRMLPQNVPSNEGFKYDVEELVQVTYEI